MKNSRQFFVFIFCSLCIFLTRLAAQEIYHETYRNQVHFSPKEKWINDPNGMVYYNGVYHLFFQYYPDSTVWGPMHWGHTTSSDLVHWNQQPIALFPDSLGYIFSGSAVVDANNTSGFGSAGKPPLVAVYTNHNPAGEKAGKNNFQNQSIAYSLDEGKTWSKYDGNPVLINPGIKDFRDPKVMWYQPGKKWIMTLATQDRITFYSSKNLKKWIKESEFGKAAGAHGGVWECPDLFALDDNGKKIWVVIVSINPGGPNKGSATQYFLGDFNGNQFTPFNTRTKWLDYGPDDYAGVTWYNTNRKIFLGWMSNWLYANVVPTEKWRNAMTIPRELKIKHSNNDIMLTSMPVTELNDIGPKTLVKENITVSRNYDLTEEIKTKIFPCQLTLSLDKIKDFSVVVSNSKEEKIVVGYEKLNNTFYFNRNNSGKTAFQKDFAGKFFAPRLTGNQAITIKMIIDVSSIELFADDGLTVMTGIFFPNQPYNQLSIQSQGSILIKKLEYINLKSIWP